MPGLGRRTRRTTADGAGRFAFADLPFGLYRLARLLPEGKQQEMFGINVQIVDATPLELELLPLGVGTVSGTLTCAVEIPEGTTVMLEPVYDDNVPPAVRGSTRHARSRGGAFVFEGVEPGRYALRAHFYDAATGAWIYGRTPAEVQDGGESRLELALDQRK